MRAEPNMLTDGLICASRSKPSTNSATIWKIFQDSRVRAESLGVFRPRNLSFSCISSGPVIPCCDMGAAGWRAGPSGWIEDEGTGGSGTADLERELGLDDEFGGFAWIRIMHPIPLLPNVKLTYTPLKFDGSGTVGSGFQVGGVSFA